MCTDEFSVLSAILWCFESKLWVGYPFYWALKLSLISAHLISTQGRFWFLYERISPLDDDCLSKLNALVVMWLQELCILSLKWSCLKQLLPPPGKQAKLLMSFTAWGFLKPLEFPLCQGQGLVRKKGMIFYTCIAFLPSSYIMLQLTK